MKSPFSVWGNVAAAAWLLVAAGCESSTGVLIEVTRDDTVPARLGRLAFHVGVDGVAGGASRFVDPDPEEEVRLDGRDVAADPYRLLIRPSDDPESRVMVGVVAYAGGEVVGFGALDEPVRFLRGEVTLWRIVLRGRMPDGFDVTDTECVTWVDEEGHRVTIGHPRDQDCDGWGEEEDCNDLDPRANPDASEDCGNRVDDDCDGETDENVDDDGDLVTTCDGDCNDSNPAIHPGAAEVCDGVDNDCNDRCDENLDRDGDAFTDCGSRIVEGGAACLFRPDRRDCDDSDETFHPGAVEECDGVDNDCNDVCDDSGAGLDRDGDGFTACGSMIGQCGKSQSLIDCQDDDPGIHPGAVEMCNGDDDDCDGEFLQRGPCFVDDDVEGCVLGRRECAERPREPGDWVGPCELDPGLDPALSPAPDGVCTAYDNACSAEPDPHSCALESSGLPITSCAVTYEIAGGEPCTKAELELPTGGLDCSWRVVGGSDQGDYRVGLRAVADPPDGNLEPVLDRCAALLVVETRSTAKPPSPFILLLARNDMSNAETTYFPVSLVPAPVGECDPSAGLECGSFHVPP